MKSVESGTKRTHQNKIKQKAQRGENNDAWIRLLK